MDRDGDGRARQEDERDHRRRRTALVVGIVVVAVLAFAAGVLAAGSLGGGDEPTEASSMPTSSPTEEPSPDPEPSPSEEPPIQVLEDGRHFVQAERVLDEGGERLLEFDLAYLLEGEEADQAAADRGLETPVPNDYLIVNDNPRLRQLPIAPDARVLHIPTDRCCEPLPGDLDDWATSVNGSEVPGYTPGDLAWWWIEVNDGRIVTIEEQYFP
jgi:hypothetical protein